MARKRDKASRARVLLVSKTQIGTSNLRRDKELSALPPGKRRSRSGKIYWEKRRNRSDLRNRV